MDISVLKLLAQDLVDESVVMGYKESLAGVTIELHTGQPPDSCAHNGGTRRETHSQRITSWYRSGSASIEKILYTNGLTSTCVLSSYRSMR